MELNTFSFCSPLHPTQHPHMPTDRLFSPSLCLPKTSADSQPKQLLILLQERARQAAKPHHHPLPRAANLRPSRLRVKH